MTSAQDYLDLAQPNTSLLQSEKLYQQGELYYIQHIALGTLPNDKLALSTIR